MEVFGVWLQFAKSNLNSLEAVLSEPFEEEVYDRQVHFIGLTVETRICLQECWNEKLAKHDARSRGQYYVGA